MLSYTHRVFTVRSRCPYTIISSEPFLRCGRMIRSNKWQRTNKNKEQLYTPWKINMESENHPFQINFRRKIGFHQVFWIHVYMLSTSVRDVFLTPSIPSSTLKSHLSSKNTKSSSSNPRLERSTVVLSSEPIQMPQRSSWNIEIRGAKGPRIQH